MKAIKFSEADLLLLKKVKSLYNIKSDADAIRAGLAALALQELPPIVNPDDKDHKIIKHSDSGLTE